VPVLDSGRSDADLIAAHVAGDSGAFGELVARHRDRMWAVALRTLRDPEEAADAVQEALISAFRAAARFRAESAVTTWLHRIVVNACLDRIRRKQVRPTVPLPEEGSGTPGDPAVLAAPRDAMADRELQMDITDALATLPDEQRAAIVLVDIEGYPVAEVARMLEVAEGTVKSRCARGRAKLAVLLGHLRNQDSSSGVEASKAASGSGPPTGRVGGGAAPHAHRGSTP
jgi:RNA polymerase sigma-70 factor (ECF subfamily)